LICNIDTHSRRLFDAKKLAHQWEKEEEEVWRLFRGVYETALSPLRLFFTQTNLRCLERLEEEKQKCATKFTFKCSDVKICAGARNGIRVASSILLFFPSYSNFSCHFHFRS
jgi:hypothetical protein